MTEKEELEQFLKVDPKVVQALLQFKTYKQLQKLNSKLAAYVTFMGPMTRMFKRDLQFQYGTVQAGQSGTVWFMKNPQPELLVGVITEVGNDWFSDTFLEWFIDHKPKKVEYQIAPTNNPKEFQRGIPFYRQVKWVAHNQDEVEHTFGVLVDGFFLPKQVYDKIVRENL